ncbi:MAG: amidohydrolase family protein [Ktedonobacteraceae bacterium]
MPDFSIIDTHVHLWNPQLFPIPWLAQVPGINRPFGLAEYRDQTANFPITGIVYVEVDVAPQFALLEAQLVVALAAQDSRLQGIVAAAPLEYGKQVRPYLDALRALGPLIKGVRRNIQDETDPEFCLRPAFIQGVQLLAEYGFSFDICIRHHQLPAITRLVHLCPEIQFILDHLGKPAIREQELDPWRANLEQLAALPNVCCKLSGLLTEANTQHWQLADLVPYVTHALTVFGTQRILFGGDWPVLLQAASYEQWVKSVELMLAHVPEAAQHDIWMHNAQRCYRLITAGV